MLTKGKMYKLNGRNMKFININRQKIYSLLYTKKQKQMISLSNITSMNEQSTRIKTEQVNTTSNNYYYERTKATQSNECRNVRKDILMSFSSMQENDDLDQRNVFVAPKPRMLKMIGENGVTRKVINERYAIDAIVSHNHTNSRGNTNSSKRINKGLIIDKNKKHIKHQNTMLKIEEVLYGKQVKIREENDIVNYEDLFTSQLKRKVRESLLADINLNAHNDILLENDQFYDKVENRVNFLDDIYRVPHLMNNFSINKGLDCEDGEEKIKQKLTDANCLTPNFVTSITKARRRSQYRKDNFTGLPKTILSFINTQSQKLGIVPVKKGNMMDAYEIDKFFGKPAFYKGITIANDREKQAILSIGK